MNFWIFRIVFPLKPGCDLGADKANQASPQGRRLTVYDKMVIAHKKTLEEEAAAEAADIGNGDNNCDY